VTALTVGLLALVATALILTWSSWRFGATMPGTIWARCLLGCTVLTTCASLTEGWMHARFIPWWLEASTIGVREEGLKLLFFIILADADPDTRSPGDRLHAMTAVALGFAVLEACSKAMPLGSMSHVLTQTYVGLYAGTILHVFFSLQAAAFFILARRRSWLWLLGIIIPMVLHSIWDNLNLVGISSVEAAAIARISIMATVVLLALALAQLSGARPNCGTASRRSAIVAMSLWITLTTAVQVAGKAGWAHGITVTPYALLAVGWWIVSLDLAIACLWIRRSSPLILHERT